MVVKKVNRSINDFIEKGADVKESKSKDFKNVLFRIPTSVLTELDKLVEKKPWLNRTQWIVEAINDKIKSEYDASKEDNRAGN